MKTSFIEVQNGSSRDEGHALELLGKKKAPISWSLFNMFSFAYAPNCTRLKADTVNPLAVLSKNLRTSTELSFTNS